MNLKASDKIGDYFLALDQAVEGLGTFLQDEASTANKHGLIAAIVDEYLIRLKTSLDGWESRIAFESKFRVSRSESGFPVFQNVLDLKNDRDGAEEKLAKFREEDEIREMMVDFILTKKQFPAALQKEMAKRQYYSAIQSEKHFGPLVLPKTVRVSVNPKTGRPYYVVHWGFYDGAANLPIIYMLTVEDSSPDIVKLLVGPNNKLNREVNIDLPIAGLLNPELAVKFDEFCEKNSAYSLMLSTIATNCDQDFDHLHPKQLRRFVLGPFYHAAYTSHGEKVDQILARVRNPKNAWLMTWTLQEIYSVNEKPAKWGLWSSQPAREHFHIDTDDLECVQQGVTSFERHALVPHEAYQAIYAAGMDNEIFDGYQRHVISDGHVLRNM